MNRNFSIDPFSFFLGFLLSTVLWWMINAAKPVIKQLKKNFEENQTKAKERGVVGMEDRYRKLVLRQAQAMHVAASLFALDEIVQPPRLLAPPPRIEPGMPNPGSDIVTTALPYMPAWPEMAAAYKAPSISLGKALSGGSNIIIIGQPGTGKSVALAHLATQIVNQHPEVEHLHNYYPFLIHVADLDLPAKPEDLLYSFVETIAEKVSVFDLSRTPKFVHSAFELGRVLLLLDGVDELPPDEIKKVAEFLKTLGKAYPKTRMVTTGNPDYVDGFSSLGFAPLAIMPWSVDDQNKFLARWTELWTGYVANETWAVNAFQPVDPILLNRWLKTDPQPLTPLEYTLKVWGIYAGDIRGPRPLDAIATHIRRMMPANTPPEALEIVAVQANSSTSAIFDSKRAHEWVKLFEPVVTEVPVSPDGTPLSDATITAESLPVEGQTNPEGAPETPNKSKKPEKKKGSEKPAPPPPSIISKLSKSGLLLAHRGNRLRFAHPVFGGYLAGKSLDSAAADTLLNQPAWSGRNLAFNYVAATGDARNIVATLLSTEDEIMQRGVFAAARLLREAPREAPWRGQVMMALVNTMQSERPVTMRCQAVAAIAFSGDSSGAALFRQFMQVPSPEIRQMAALGSGAMRDMKAVEILAQLTHDMNPPVSRAACLALVLLDSPAGLEAIASLLMHGEEDQRRTAAEALAGNTHAGYETLKEGATAEDILLRRAVVYGLARLETEAWANELLEKIQVQDAQWVVRNTAVEILESREHPNPRVPKKLPPPHESPWLIEFAAKQGMGLAPGAPSGDILLRALKSDNLEERYAALTYLRLMPTEGVISGLYKIYFGDDHDLREAIFIVLWEYSIGGVKIPSPKQFGLG